MGTTIGRHESFEECAYKEIINIVRLVLMQASLGYTICIVHNEFRTKRVETIINCFLARCSVGQFLSLWVLFCGS